MSRFKSLFLFAVLLIGLSGLAQGAAFAQGGAAVALQGPEQRVALVIGNSKYQNVVELPNPDNDAQSVAQLLNSAGFEVIAATDLTHNDMIKVVQEFSARVAAREPNTVAMVYYAGHGVQLAGENYLIPVDAKISSPSDLIDNSLRLVDLMATLEAIPSRLRIVVLDACRNNPFPAVNDAGRGLAIVDAPNGSIVGYSTAPGTEALDGSGEHSPFTSAFLHLAREPNVPIEQLFKRVRLEVNHSTDGEQTPWESSSLTSDFYFFGDTAVAATRAPARGPVVQVASNLPSRSVRQAYDFVLSEGSPEYYQEFIELFPDDPLCAHIRWLLGNLLEAAAWHKAVLANSPLAYQAFYESHVNSSYAMAALKLQAQPKTLSLNQPSHLILPQHLAPTLAQGGQLNNKFEGDPHLQSGKLVALPSHGSETIPANGSGNGKITNMPVQTVSKTVSSEERKTNSATNKGLELQTTRHEFQTNRHDENVARFNSNSGLSAAKHLNGNNNAMFSKPAGNTTGNFGPRLAQSMGGGGMMGGGGFGHRR
jgi:hypothetical protein